jgi:hypothetical protein
MTGQPYTREWWNAWEANIAADAAACAQDCLEWYETFKDSPIAADREAAHRAYWLSKEIQIALDNGTPAKRINRVMIARVRRIRDLLQSAADNERGADE